MEEKQNEVPFSSLEMIDALGQVTPIEFQPFDVEPTVDDGTQSDGFYLQDEKQGGGTQRPSSRKKLMAKTTRRSQQPNVNSDQRNTLSGHELSAPPIIVEEAAGEPAAPEGAALIGSFLIIEKGEDILSKIVSLSEDGTKAVTILTAFGSVSDVSLWRPYPFFDPVTYKGIFTILTFSGLYLPMGRTGGFNISLQDQNGVIFGGRIGGPLIAASTTQIAVGTFPYVGP